MHSLVRAALGSDVVIASEATATGVPQLVIATEDGLALALQQAEGAPVVIVVSDEESGRRVLAEGATHAILEPVDSPAARLALRSASSGRQRRPEPSTRERSPSSPGVEDQLQHSARLATIGEISAAVAHEINNPLQFISVCLNEMRAHTMATMRGHEGADLRALLDDALEGVDRIRSITVELLPFARSTPSELEDVDLVRSVRRALRMVHNDLRHRARIVTELEAVPLVRGDARRLTQVFTNILLNAAQAIEEGAAEENTIRISSGVSGERAVITIADSGRGMTEEQQQRVFERFFTTKPSGRGTGLGMSVSLEIVRAHGGHIAVSSELGRGTEVTVALPVSKVQRVPTRPPLSQPRAAARLRVLAVDDDLLVLRSYRRALGKHHELVFASDGEDALTVLDDDREFDVILCDLMMPNMDGPRFFEALEAEHPELAERVVFCSGGTFTQRADAFVRACQRPVIHKPAPIEQLLEVLHEVAVSAAPRSLQANSNR